MSIELEWQRPSQTYGDLIGYRLKHGVKDQALKVEHIQDTSKTTYSFKDLGTKPQNYVPIARPTFFTQMTPYLFTLWAAFR